MEIYRIDESAESVKKIYMINDAHQIIESCLLNLTKHGTVICVSCQIGCRHRCRFCATGILEKFVRNLNANELLQQTDMIINKYPEAFEDNFQISFMGSGEPLNNFENVNAAMCDMLSKYKNLKKLNVSTVMPLINFGLFDESQYVNKVHLQFSLQFVNDFQRKKYIGDYLPTIKESLECLENYANKLNDKVAINYIPLDGINDGDEDIKQIIKIMKSNRFYLKISDLCDVNKSVVSKSKRLGELLRVINDSGIDYEYFRSLGTDVNAGCGQFYNNSIM